MDRGLVSAYDAQPLGNGTVIAIGLGAPLWEGSVGGAWRDAVMSAVALAIILMVLVSFDSRVREQVDLRLSSPSAVVSEAGHGLRSLAASSRTR